MANRFQKTVLTALVAAVLLVPSKCLASHIERFFLEAGVAPLHNEVVGTREVDRYYLGLNLRFALVENKDGVGIFA